MFHFGVVTTPVDGPDLRMLSLMEHLTPELFMHAIVLGSTTAVKSFLDKHPSEVRFFWFG